MRSPRGVARAARGGDIVLLAGHAAAAARDSAGLLVALWGAPSTLCPLCPLWLCALGCWGAYGEGAHGLLQLLQPRVGGAGGQLAVVLLKPEGRWATARTVRWAALGPLGQDPAVRSLACTELTVSPSGWRKGRVKVAFDGERERMDAPQCFKLYPRPVWLVAPTRLERTPASPVAPLSAAAGAALSLVTAY